MWLAAVAPAPLSRAMPVVCRSVERMPVGRLRDGTAQLAARAPALALAGGTSARAQRRRQRRGQQAGPRDRGATSPLRTSIVGRAAPPGRPAAAQPSKFGAPAPHPRFESGSRHVGAILGYKYLMGSRGRNGGRGRVLQGPLRSGARCWGPALALWRQADAWHEPHNSPAPRANQFTLRRSRLRRAVHSMLQCRLHRTPWTHSALAIAN